MKIEIFQSLNAISESQWQKIASPCYPFISYKFLEAFESCGCLGSRTGWTPAYITAWEQDSLVGALLLYFKDNSYGEYIFDFSWAQAHESAGISYYPKLVSAVPFTPASSPKILLQDTLSAEDKKRTAQFLLKAALKKAQESGVSSLHALFILEGEISLFQENGFFIRHSYQFHWQNKNYSSFQDFLLGLKSKRRKEIVRERNQVLDSGVKISRFTGSSLKPQHAEIMYQFYRSTIDKMNGFEYLTPEFFKFVFETMKRQILFVLAEDASGRPVAGALNFLGLSTLFGRYWGCLEEYRALHFELCYYQGIDYAIENKLQLFEAGAQGEHKVQRGFLPELTYSAHWIKDLNLDPAIRDFVKRERQQIQLVFEEYAEHTPFSAVFKVT